jgi:hypothetical protein
MSDKGIKLVSSPETQPPWPIPPDYVPLWSVSQIEEAIEELVYYRGHEAMPTVNQADMVKLVLRMKKDYDLALAKAQLDAWTHEGMAHNG